MKRAYRNKSNSGFALVITMIFIMVFSALSVAMFTMSVTSVQASENHRESNRALNAAQSGLECARYVIATVPTFETGYNYISDDEADIIWSNLCGHFQTQQLGGLSVCDATEFCDANGSGDQIISQSVPYSNSGANFQVRFYRYDDSKKTIHVQCTGQDGVIERNVGVEISITKDAEVLNYALAGRGRMWLAGDTTIHGDVYSSWDRTDISPFNMTSDSTVEGSLNTVLPWQDILQESYQMQEFEYNGGNLVLNDNKYMASNGNLLDSNGNPITNSGGYPIDILDLDFENVDSEYNIAVDSGGNPIEGFVNGVSIGAVTYGNPVEAFEEDGSRVYTSGDELLGEYETVNYNQPTQDDIPGLDISDYDTDMYRDLVMGSGGNGDIASSSTIISEYFPHAAGNYSQPASSSSRRVTRHVYENMTFTNTRLPDNRNALFKNCTFEEVLYVDCYKSTSSYYNNVRFEDCTFNGVIVTDTPSTVKWQYNALYFTGTATFNNTSSIQEATILAPHFNVDLGNTNPEQSDNNVITGAIVGGIVDVRGNAQINGTIISMFDTTNYSSGFVTNIGATLDDGGSETTELGDIGTIEITPDEEQMLPSGIKSPVVLKQLNDTYQEIH